jgi:hypothetical protein
MPCAQKQPSFDEWADRTVHLSGDMRRPQKEIGWLPKRRGGHPEVKLEFLDQFRDIHSVSAGWQHVLSQWSEAGLHRWVETGVFSWRNGFDLLCIVASGTLVWRCAGL